MRRFECIVAGTTAYVVALVISAGRTRKRHATESRVLFRHTHIDRDGDNDRHVDI